MLAAKNILTLLAFGAITATAAPQPRSYPSDCKDLYVGTLLVDGPGGNHNKVAAFAGERDDQGRLQLSTLYEGQESPASAQFAFVQCSSGVMPSGPVENKDGSTTYYGVLKPNYHRTKCASITSLDTTGTLRYSPIVSAACQSSDTGSLAEQYWGLTVRTIADGSGRIQRTLRFVGATAAELKGSSASTPPYSATLAGDGRSYAIVELTKATTPFELYLQ